MESVLTELEKIIITLVFLWIVVFYLYRVTPSYLKALHMKHLHKQKMANIDLQKFKNATVDPYETQTSPKN